MKNCIKSFSRFHSGGFSLLFKKSQVREKMPEERDIYSNYLREKEDIDYTFRPKSLNDFIGQNRIIENMRVYITAARQRGESIDHVIFSGPPGLGKTTLAFVTASEMGVEYHYTSAPALEKKGDLAAILTKMKDKDVLFIDEIHRLRPELEEILYSAMEDFHVNIVMGQGISANSITIPIPRFTLIGATTRTGLLTRPLLSRFGIDMKLELYSIEDIIRIIFRSVQYMQIAIDKAAAQEIALRSRGTPRIANRLLRRIRDFAQVHGTGSIDKDVTDLAFRELDIDESGLTHTDRKLLEFILSSCRGGPVGVETIAVSIGETSETIEDVVEPYLIQQGYIVRTQRGRCITKKVYDLFGKSVPDYQQFLF